MKHMQQQLVLMNCSSSCDTQADIKANEKKMCFRGTESHRLEKSTVDSTEGSKYKRQTKTEHDDNHFCYNCLAARL